MIMSAMKDRQRSKSKNAMARYETENALYVGLGLAALFFGVFTIVAGTVDVFARRGDSTENSGGVVRR
jgi:hypothetical protein